MLDYFFVLSFYTRGQNIDGGQYRMNCVLAVCFCIFPYCCEKLKPT